MLLFLNVDEIDAITADAFTAVNQSGTDRAAAELAELDEDVVEKRPFLESKKGQWGSP